MPYSQPGYYKIFPILSEWTNLAANIPSTGHVDGITIVGTLAYITYSTTTGERFWLVGDTSDFSQNPPENWGVQPTEFDDAIQSPKVIVPPQLSTIGGKEALQCTAFHDRYYYILAGTDQTNPAVKIYAFDQTAGMEYAFEYLLTDENGASLDLHKIRWVQIIQDYMVVFSESSLPGTLVAWVYNIPTDTQPPGTPQPRFDIVPSLAQSSSTTVLHGVYESSDSNIVVILTDENNITQAIKLGASNGILTFIGKETFFTEDPQPTWASSSNKSFYVQYGELILVVSFVPNIPGHSVYANLYIDNVTSIPDPNNSTIVFSDNSLKFGQVDPVLIEFRGRDRFGEVTSNINVKFKIRDMTQPFGPGDPSIAEFSGGPFRDSSGNSLASEVVVKTDILGVARAYFLPPMEGTGIEMYAVDVLAPV